MNDFLGIFSDVVRLATLQPRHVERLSSAPGFHEPERERVARVPRRFRTRGF